MSKDRGGFLGHPYDQTHPAATRHPSKEGRRKEGFPLFLTDREPDLRDLTLGLKPKRLERRKRRSCVSLGEKAPERAAPSLHRLERLPAKMLEDAGVGLLLRRAVGFILARGFAQFD